MIAQYIAKNLNKLLSAPHLQIYPTNYHEKSMFSQTNTLAKFITSFSGWFQSQSEVETTPLLVAEILSRTTSAHHKLWRLTLRIGKRQDMGSIWWNYQISHGETGRGYAGLVVLLTKQTIYVSTTVKLPYPAFRNLMHPYHAECAIHYNHSISKTYEFVKFFQGYGQDRPWLAIIQYQFTVYYIRKSMKH